jgi:hypothetical protein
MYKSETLVSSNLQVIIRDASTNAEIAELPPFRNTSSWTELSTNVVIPAHVKAVSLQFQAKGPPQGRLWIDDVKLEAR